MLETLDYTIRIGSTLTFLYFDLITYFCRLTCNKVHYHILQFVFGKLIAAYFGVCAYRRVFSPYFGCIPETVATRGVFCDIRVFLAFCMFCFFSLSSYPAEMNAVCGGVGSVEIQIEIYIKTLLYCWYTEHDARGNLSEGPSSKRNWVLFLTFWRKALTRRVHEPFYTLICCPLLAYQNIIYGLSNTASYKW